jgi:hypothetical protein
MRKPAVVPALLVLVVAAPAAAQSFYLQGATLSRDGASVGEVGELAVDVVSWPSPTTARLHHADAAVTLEADVDTADADDYLMAGVGRDVALSGTGRWRVRMLAGTWAPVLRGSRTEVRVALPRELPVSWGVFPAGAAPATGEPDGGPWAYDDDAPRDDADAEPVPRCPRLRLRPVADDGAEAWAPGPTILDLRQVERRGSWALVRIRHGGFEVDGWAESWMLQCEETLGGLGAGGFGSSCGDGIVMGRAVRLPAGTQLYAAPDAAEPFATLHNESVGLEPGILGYGMGCIGDVCKRSPPEPSGTAQWIVEPAGTDGRMLLQGYVKTPAEDLIDVDPDERNPGGGFGLCSQTYDDWPRP